MGHQQPEYAPIQLTLQKKAKLDFPGGPGVETLSSSAEGTGCIPGWGIKIPHVAKKRQKATPSCCCHPPAPPPFRFLVLPAVLAERGLSRTPAYLSPRLLQHAQSSSTGNLSVCTHHGAAGSLRNTPLLPDSLPGRPCLLAFPHLETQPSGPTSCSGPSVRRAGVHSAPGRLSLQLPSLREGVTPCSGPKVLLEREGAEEAQAVFLRSLHFFFFF